SGCVPVPPLRVGPCSLSLPSGSGRVPYPSPPGRAVFLIPPLRVGPCFLSLPSGSGLATSPATLGTVDKSKTRSTPLIPNFKQSELQVSATQQAEDVPETAATGVKLTDAAADKVKALIEQEGEEGL